MLEPILPQYQREFDRLKRAQLRVSIRVIVVGVVLLFVLSILAPGLWLMWPLGGIMAFGFITGLVFEAKKFAVFRRDVLERHNKSRS